MLDYLRPSNKSLRDSVNFFSQFFSLCSSPWGCPLLSLRFTCLSSIMSVQLHPVSEFSTPKIVFFSSRISIWFIFLLFLFQCQCFPLLCWSFHSLEISHFPYLLVPIFCSFWSRTLFSFLLRLCFISWFLECWAIWDHIMDITNLKL